MGKRENEIIGLSGQFFEKIDFCLGEMGKMVEAYINDDRKLTEELYEKVDGQETEIDGLRRQISKKLFEGAFLPLLREEWLNFLETADKIADEAEASTDFLILQKPLIPEDLKEKLKELISGVITSFQPLRDGFSSLFKDFSTTLSYVEKVNIKETEVDKKEEELVKLIFEKDMELAQKILLRELVNKIADISDRIEDSADRLEILIIKKRL